MKKSLTTKKIIAKQMILRLHLDHEVILFAIKKFCYKMLTDYEQKLIICHALSEQK